MFLRLLYFVILPPVRYCTFLCLPFYIFSKFSWRGLFEHGVVRRVHLHVHISGGFLSSHSRCSAMDSICFGPSGVKCSGSLFPYRRGSPNIPGRNGSNMTVTEECSAYFPYTVTIRGLPEHGNARLLKMCLTGPVHSHPCPLLSGSAYK